jgi:hypothetical protein
MMGKRKIIAVIKEKPMGAGNLKLGWLRYGQVLQEKTRDLKVIDRLKLG